MCWGRVGYCSSFSTRHKLLEMRTFIRCLVMRLGGVDYLERVSVFWGAYVWGAPALVRRNCLSGSHPSSDPSACQKRMIQTNAMGV